MLLTFSQSDLSASLVRPTHSLTLPGSSELNDQHDVCRSFRFIHSPVQLVLLSSSAGRSALKVTLSPVMSRTEKTVLSTFLSSSSSSSDLENTQQMMQGSVYSSGSSLNRLFNIELNVFVCGSR